MSPKYDDLNPITLDLLSLVTDFDGQNFDGAYNIRQDGGCAGRHSTPFVSIENKADQPGIDIRVLAGAKNQKVSIPALVTHGGIDDLVYNDFYIGENAEVTITAGCGVHSDHGLPARHNGIHRFFLEPGAKVTYTEKHVGTGSDAGARAIDPVTEIFLQPGAELTMETTQLGGVDLSVRKTKAVLEAGSRLYIHERLLTDGRQQAESDFEVTVQGDDAGVDLISRSVARGSSYQMFRSRITGAARCQGHSACDAIITDNGRVAAIPELYAQHADAALIHEAAIGRIAGEQIQKLCTLGLTEEQAEARIIGGFLK